LTPLNQPPNNNNTNSHKQGYLQVQPNPNNGQFAVNISLPATAVPQMAILQVADSAGRIIYTQNINNTGGTQQQSITINLAQPLTAGTYKVSVKTNSYVLASTMVVL
ncbi:MAG TPA: T9SS type A sorting domain-containing protein, partial [Chitinophagales bacterium]|nr:T9SS type A sorting domain-containing protein [Chitinophagales bacterium]